MESIFDHGQMLKSDQKNTQSFPYHYLMDLASIPSYSDLFDEPIPELANLLGDIPSLLLIAVASAINAELHLSKSKAVSDKKILDFLLLRQQPDIKKAIYFKLAMLQGEKRSVGLFATNYLVELMHHVFCNYSDFEIEDTTREQELRIFKAYLLIADLYNKRNEYNFDDNRKYEGDFFHKYTWPLMAQQYEANMKVNPITEMARGLVFLNFFGNHPKYKIYLDNFLSTKQRLGPWNYIMDILNVIQESWTADATGILSGNRYKMALVENFESMFEPLCLDINDYASKDRSATTTFASIKATPLFKMDQTYLVLDWNAFAGKLYEGLVFDFHQVSGISKEPEINSIADFKKLIGPEITEKFLFEKLLRTMFQEKHTVLKFDRNKQDGFPDAYYRKGNDVILFEIKDAYFPARAISSTDFMKIKQAIDLKYNNSKKGLGQFIKHLLFLKTGSFEDPKRYKSSKNLKIHPVIVYTDQMFGMPGTNHYLQEEFAKKIEENGLGTAFKKINPVTIIDIRFFVNYINILRDKDPDIFKMLESYQLFLKRSEKKAKKVDEMKVYFDCYLNFDDVVPGEFPDRFKKRDDYVKLIVDSLELTQRLPLEKSE